MTTTPFPPDFSVPPPSSTTMTGRLDNSLFAGPGTTTIWDVNNPNILNNIGEDQQPIPGNLDMGMPMLSNQPPDRAMSFSELAFAMGGVAYLIQQLDGLFKGLYQHAVYMSDPRLVELGLRPEGIARDLWHWTSLGIQQFWIPLRVRSQIFRDLVVRDALNEVPFQQELARHIEERRRSHQSFRTAESSTQTQDSGYMLLHYFFFHS